MGFFCLWSLSDAAGRVDASVGVGARRERASAKAAGGPRRGAVRAAAIPASVASAELRPYAASGMASCPFGLVSCLLFCRFFMFFLHPVSGLRFVSSVPLTNFFQHAAEARLADAEDELERLRGNVFGL